MAVHHTLTSFECAGSPGWSAGTIGDTGTPAVLRAIEELHRSVDMQLAKISDRLVKAGL